MNEYDQEEWDNYDLDLGHNHRLRYFQWDPDLELNPQYEHIREHLSVLKAGASVNHLKSDGSLCRGAVHFDLPVLQGVFAKGAKWQVLSWEPLTLAPSLLCGACGDHGFIREGKWVVA